jgi:hypothetical protein
LVVSAYAAQQSCQQNAEAETTGIGWVKYTASNSAGVSWDATGVFKGSSYYGTISGGNASDRALSARTNNHFSFYVTKTTKVSALVCSKSKSRTITMDVYPVTFDSEGKATRGDKAGTASDNSNSIIAITVDGLDASTIYEVEIYGSDNTGAHFYEIAFFGEGGEPVTPSDPTEATTWNFTELSSADEENLTSDDANWAYDSEKERYSYIPSFTSSEGKANNIVLKANDAELNIIKGLLFGRDGSIETKKFSIDKGKGINFAGSKYRMIIPNLVKDDIVKVRFAGAGDGDRGITLSNVGTENSANSSNKETVESTFTVAENGSVMIETTGGLTIIALAVNDNLPETSGVKVINAEVISNGATYNLGGQHVNDSYHGVVIKNGKKIVKK